MNKLILLTMLVACVMAQGMGDGVSKSTWGSSDPVKCGAFIKKYLPVKEAPDDCKNGKCECATQGRFQLENGTNFGGFGIHTINCTQHPYGEHSLEDVENMIHGEWGDFKSYHPFMDYNAQFYTPDLSEYIAKFKADNVPFTGLKFKSDDEKTYYSAIINACGYVVIELISPKVSDESDFTETEMVRFHFNERNNLPNIPHEKRLQAIGVSRASARLDEIKAFYHKDIGIDFLKEENYKDGSVQLTYMWSKPTKGIQLNFFVNRVAPTGAKFTTKNFEDYMRSVHDKIMVSDVCGFDQWMDNHYAYDGKHGAGAPPTMLDEYANHAKKLGLPYHWWSMPSPPSMQSGSGMQGGQMNGSMPPLPGMQGGSMIGMMPPPPFGHGPRTFGHGRQLQPGPPSGGLTQLYMSDPTGFGIQFDGPARNPPKNIPEYSAACKSDDGCAGQGLKTCKDTDFFTKFLQ